MVCTNRYLRITEIGAGSGIAVFCIWGCSSQTFERLVPLSWLCFTCLLFLPWCINRKGLGFNEMKSSQIEMKTKHPRRIWPFLAHGFPEAPPASLTAPLCPAVVLCGAGRVQPWLHLTEFCEETFLSVTNWKLKLEGS